MKMFKKAAAFALAVTMLGTCLAGCGSSSESSGSGDGGNGSSSALKIGGIGPVTGAAAIYGQAVKNGAQIAVDEINEKGDLQFELKFEDDEYRSFNRNKQRPHICTYSVGFVNRCFGWSA